MKHVRSAALAGSLLISFNSAAVAENSMSVVEVLKRIMPHECVLRNENATKQEKIEATKGLYDAQRGIIGFFGDGPEMTVQFNHKGKTYNAPVDLDAGLLRFWKNEWFTVRPTPALIEPAHQLIQADLPGMQSADSQKQEDTLRKQARSQFIPFGTRDTQAYEGHLKSVHDFEYQTVWNIALDENAQSKTVVDFISEKTDELFKVWPTLSPEEQREISCP